MKTMAIGAPEILIIAGIVVFLFGASKLPKLARSLGEAQGEYAKAKREATTDAAAASAPASASGVDEQTRAAAEALGISTAGKSADEIKREMRARLD